MYAQHHPTQTIPRKGLLGCIPKFGLLLTHLLHVKCNSTFLKKKNVKCNSTAENE
jgi:hypothetical protein